jgi:farnesyl diphosphate synthase
VLGHEAPAALREAMRYAVLDGGKRLRPLLVLAAREAVRAHEPDAAHAVLDDAALRAACAAELIHAYSLVHDDMPCMDNDILRRGKPTVHVRFGEAQALLAGDALQALAFELLTPDTNRSSAARGPGAAVPPAGQGRGLRRHGRRPGHRSGQHRPAAHRRPAARHAPPEDRRAAARQRDAGCGLHPAPRQPAGAALAALATYGAALGLAFQVVDDILDVTADSATLGKTAGKDAAQDKPTYVSVLGLERSHVYAQELLAQALAALDASGLSDTRALRALADMVVNRGS